MGRSGPLGNLYVAARVDHDTQHDNAKVTQGAAVRQYVGKRRNIRSQRFKKNVGHRARCTGRSLSEGVITLAGYPGVTG